MMPIGAKIESQMEAILLNPDIPGDEVWRTSIGKNYLRDKYIDWVLGLADWRVFLTLTFRNAKYYDVAINHWKRFVFVLNKSLLGKNYSRKVGHSYFSYILGIEKQSRGDYHFHVLTDKPLDFKLIHEFWGREHGFAKTEIIRVKSESVKYITKYLCKGGILEPYKCEKDFKPTLTPYWWKFDILQERYKDM